MARWKLTEKHYLNVPGTRWESSQTDRATGRQIRKVFNVPLYLDPDSEGDWNYRDGFDGFIVVCHEGKGEGRDIVFIGDPTPGMLPLDEEAREITSHFTWTPTQGTDDLSQANSWGQQVLRGLIDQMSDAQAKAAQGQTIHGLDKLLEAITGMMAQQTEILMRLTAPTQPVQVVLNDAEQVVDEEPPLEDAEEPTAEEIEEASKVAAAKEAASIRKATEHASRRRV